MYIQAIKVKLENSSSQEGYYYLLGRGEAARGRLKASVLPLAFLVYCQRSGIRCDATGLPAQQPMVTKLI